MPRPSARPVIALLATALVLGACGGTSPAAPTAAVGSGGATGTPSGASGATAPGTPAAGSATAGSSPATPGPAGSPGTPGSPAGGSPAGGSPAGGSPPAGSPTTGAPPGGASPAATAASNDQPTIGIPGLGLSLRLPPGWVGLDATVPTSILDSTGARYPDLASALESLRAGEIGFMGYDTTSTDPTTPHLTIATTGDAIAVAGLLDALAEQTATQLAKTASITDVQHSPVTLPAGPAAELRYHQKPGDGGPEVALDSWFISTAGHTFLVAFLVPVASADEWQPQFRAVAESLSGS